MPVTEETNDISKGASVIAECFNNNSGNIEELVDVSPGIRLEDFNKAIESLVCASKSDKKADKKSCSQTREQPLVSK